MVLYVWQIRICSRLKNGFLELELTVHDCSPFKSRFPFCGNNPVSQWYGHPRVLGIPIPKTLVIWTSPSHITLAIWVTVRVTGDAHIKGFGNGDAQNAGMPISLWHRHFRNMRKLGRVNFRKDFWDCHLGQRKRLANGELEQRRFWATHVNRRWTFYIPER